MDERVLHLQRLLRVQYDRLRCAGERRRTAVGEIQGRKYGRERQIDDTSLARTN